MVMILWLLSQHIRHIIAQAARTGHVPHTIPAVLPYKAAESFQPGPLNMRELMKHHATQKNKLSGGMRMHHYARHSHPSIAAAPTTGGNIAHLRQGGSCKSSTLGGRAAV
jgi:hypothetical protein